METQADGFLWTIFSKNIVWGHCTEHITCSGGDHIEDDFFYSASTFLVGVVTWSVLSDTVTQVMNPPCLVLDNCHIFGHLLSLQDVTSFPHCLPGYTYIKVFPKFFLTWIDLLLVEITESFFSSNCSLSVFLHVHSIDHCQLVWAGGLKNRIKILLLCFILKCFHTFGWASKQKTKPN